MFSSVTMPCAMQSWSAQLASVISMLDSVTWMMFTHTPWISR